MVDGKDEWCKLKAITISKGNFSYWHVTYVCSFLTLLIGNIYYPSLISSLLVIFLSGNRFVLQICYNGAKESKLLIFALLCLLCSFYFWLCFSLIEMPKSLNCVHILWWRWLFFYFTFRILVSFIFFLDRIFWWLLHSTR